MTWTYFMWSKKGQMTCTLIQAPQGLAEEIFQIHEGFWPYEQQCSDPGCCGPTCSVWELEEELEPFMAGMINRNWKVDLVWETNFTDEMKAQLLLES